MRIATTLVLTSLACLGCKTEPVGGAPEAGADAAPAAAVVGQDLDERTPRTLQSLCPLPRAYRDAIATSGLAPAQLAMPDLGLTFAVDPQRLHWTDEVRAAGDTAPSFACMVESDVENAIALGDGDTTVRELIAAQGLYGNRDSYALSRYDRAFAVDPSASSSALVGALKQFYERAPVDGDPSPPLAPWPDLQDDVAAQVATFAPAARVALAQAILGLLAAAELRDQALTSKGKLSLVDWRAQIKLYMAGRRSGAASAYDAADTMTEAMDFDLLSRSGQLAARSIESLRRALAAEALTDGAILDVTGPLGRIAVSLQEADDAWSGTTFFMLVDGGGNDTYKGDLAVNADLYHPISVVLDLAGDDRYLPTKAINVLGGSLPTDRGQGTGQAAGWFGVAILDDAAGNDEYQAGTYQAYGSYGVGVLVDHAGTDTYKGYVRSQGAADFGFGLLVDLGRSNDKYETLHNSQGFGGPHGIGWLVDDGGNDSYLAITTPIPDPSNAPYDQEGSNFSGAQGFGWGLRIAGGTLLSGGMGALFDLAGDDTYECAVMCQAWGYFFGTGLLYDKSGNDSYVVWHKYGLGGATHQAIGVFIDAQGADKYEYAAGGIATNGGSEGVGLGYDMGVGFHVDRGVEPDSYKFDQDKQKWGEVVGISRFVGLGVFLNEGGADEYHLPGVMGAYALGMTNMPTQNPPYRTAAGATNTASVGLFFDLGGTDVYDLSGSAAGNGKSWKQSAATSNSTDVFDPKLDFGFGLDGDAPWPPWPAK